MPTGLARPPRTERAGALFFALSFGVLFAAGAGVVFAGPRFVLATAAIAIGIPLAVFYPEALASRALPIVLLIPPFIRAPISGLPDATPLRLTIVVALYVALLAVFSGHRPVGWKAQYSLPILISAGIFAVWVLLVASRSDVPGAVSRGFGYAIEGLAVYLLVIWAVRTRREVFRFTDLLIAVGVVASLAALVEFATNHFLFAEHLPYFFHAPTRGGRIRVQSVFPHAIVLGVALQLLVPLAIARVLMLRGGRRVVAVCALVVLGVALLATVSRGPWVACIVAVLVMAVLLRGGRRWTVLLGILVAAVLVASSPAGGTIGNLARGVLSPGSGSGTRGTTVIYRQELLTASWNYARHHPIGVGPGGSNTIPLFGSVGGNTTQLTESVDNAYAKFALELGWIGLLLFLVLLGCVTYDALRVAWRLRADPTLGVLGAAAAGSIVGIITASATVATFTWAQLGALFWMVAAIPRLTKAVDHSTRPARASTEDVAVH